MDPNKRFRFAKKTLGQLTDALVGNSCCRPGLVILADDGEMIVKRSIVVLKLLTKGCTLIPAKVGIPSIWVLYVQRISLRLSRNKIKQNRVRIHIWQKPNVTGNLSLSKLQQILLDNSSKADCDIVPIRCDHISPRA